MANKDYLIQDIMSREEYNNIDAINASSIKRHYTGSLIFAAGALERGAEFHRNLLETEPSEMLPSPLGFEVHQQLREEPFRVHKSKREQRAVLHLEI